jgi:D-xylulose reductase
MIDLKPLVTHRYVFILRVIPTSVDRFSYHFEEAIVAFKATRAGKSEDGKGVIKAVISGPDFPAEAA